MAEATIQIALKAVNDAKAALNDLERDLKQVGNAADDADKKLDASGKQMANVDGHAKKGSGTLTKMAPLLLGVGAAAAVGIGGSVKLAMDFEHRLDAVGAVSGATAEEMGQLSDAALRIGKDTAFSASQAGEAMEILAANGISAKDIMGGAADAAVALAAAGGTTLAVAADVASTSMSVWNLKTEDMTNVVNRLAGAANVSRFGVEDMSLAIAQGGGAAAGSGVEFDDFATSIAATAQYFSSGADAGTSFKTFINSLVPTTDKAKGAFRDLGLMTVNQTRVFEELKTRGLDPTGLSADEATRKLYHLITGVKEGENSTKAQVKAWSDAEKELGLMQNAFFDAEGNMKGMAEITDLLHNATKDLTEAEKIETLQTIFGSDAKRTAIGLSQLTGEAFTDMSNKMRDTSAADVAAQRMGNLKGGFESLMGSLETIGIEFGMVLLPALTGLALWGAVAAPALFGAFSSTFGFLAEHSEIVAAVVAMIVTALIPGLAAWVVAQWALVPPLVATAAAFIAANLPLIAIVATVGLVVAAIVLLIKHWDDIVAAVPILGVVFDAAKAAVEAAITFITGVLSRFGDDVIGEFLATVEAVRPVVEFVFNAIAARIEEVFGAIAAFMEEHGSSISRILEGAWNVIKGHLEVTWAIISGLFKIWLAVITGDWSGALDAFKQMAGDVWDGIKTMLEGVWQVIAGIFTIALDELVQLLSAKWNEMKTDVETKWTAIRDFVAARWDDLMTDTNAKITAIRDFVSGVWGEVQTRTETVWGDVKTFIGDRWADIKTGIDNIKQDLLSSILWPFEQAQNAIGGLARGFGNEIISALNGAGNAVEWFGRGFIDSVNWIGGKLGVGSIIQGYVNVPDIPFLARGTQNFPGGLAVVGEEGPELLRLPQGADVYGNDTLRKLMTGIDFAVGGPFDWIADSVKTAASGVRDFVQEWAGKGGHALADMALGGLSGPDMGGDLSRLGGGMLSTLKDALIGALNDLLVKAKEAIAVGTGIWQRPLNGYFITQRFGMTDFAASGYYGGAGHSGYDLAAVTGTPVYAADTGRVSLAGWNGGYGNAVQIIHNGLSSLYGHLSSIATSLGQIVQKGDYIGAVGSTGNSTGPHLHFEAREGGRAVDPTRFVSLFDGGLIGPGSVVPGMLHGPEAVVPLGRGGAGLIDYDALAEAIVRALGRSPLLAVVESEQVAGSVREEFYRYQQRNPSLGFR